MYLSLACLSLTDISTLYAPPSTYKGVLEQKINIRFFGNVPDLLTPTTYQNSHTSQHVLIWQQGCFKEPFAK